MELEPILIPNITFSDGVIREMGTNKLTLVGTFHQFTVPQFPFATPPFFVTICLANLRGKLEGFKVAIRIEDKSSGVVIASAGGEIGSVAEVRATEVIQIPLQVATIFPSAGIYSVVVLAQSEQIGSRDLVVNAVTNIRNLPSS